MKLFLKKYLVFIVLVAVGTVGLLVYRRSLPEVNEDGLVMVKPGDEVENLVRNGNFEKGLSQEWTVYPQGKEASLKTKVVSRAEDEKYSAYTYVNESSLEVESEEANVGFEQKLKFGRKDVPYFLQANVLVFSGQVKLVVVDKEGNELVSAMVEALDGILEDISEEEIKNHWQRLPIKIENPKQADRVIIYATKLKTKYYVTNVTLHPYQDYSNMFKEFSENAASERLEKCEDLKAEEYRQCVEEVTGLPPERWNEYGKVKFEFWGEEVNLEEEPEESDVLGAQTLFRVKAVFIASDFSETFRDRFVDYVGSSWEGTGVNKKLDTSRSKIEIFDPTIPTNCSEIGYWSNTTVYLPDEFCGKDKIIFALVRVGGDGFNRGKKIFVDSDGNWGDIRYVLKHEIGHLFGADDIDLVEVRGNYIFPEGNSKEGTRFDDIMYSPQTDVSRFTVNFINSVDGVGRIGNMWKYQFLKFRFVSPNGDNLREGKYRLYKSLRGPAHGQGVIFDSFLEGGFQDGVVSFDERLLAEWEEVAIFWLVEAEGKYYEGVVDVMEMTEANFGGKNEYVIRLEEKMVPPVEIKQPKTGRVLSNFVDIRARVVDSLDFETVNWEMFLLADNTEVLISKGEGPLDENDVLAERPPSQFEDYRGNIDLVVKAYYGGESFVEKEAREENIFYDNPNIIVPEIGLVEIDLSGEVTIQGRGFGGEGENGLEIEVEELDKLVKSDELKMWRQDVLVIPAGVLFDRGLKWGSYHFSIRKDGVVSNIYLYSRQEQEPISGEENVYDWIQLKNRPNSSFFYTEDEILTEQLEYKCLKDIGKVVMGVETANGILGKKYVLNDFCRSGEDKIKGIRVTSKDANLALEAGENPYWFLCTELPDENNQFFDKQKKEIIEIMDLKRGNNVFYACHLGQIFLNKRSYPGLGKLSIRGSNPYGLNLRYYEAIYRKKESQEIVKSEFLAPSNSGLDILDNYWVELPYFVNERSEYEVVVELYYEDSNSMGRIVSDSYPVSCFEGSCSPVSIDFGQLWFQKFFGRVRLLRNGQFDYNRLRIALWKQNTKEDEPSYYGGKETTVPKTDDTSFNYSAHVPEGEYLISIAFNDGEDWLVDEFYSGFVTLKKNEVKNLDLEFDLRKSQIKGNVRLLRDKQFDYDKSRIVLRRQNVKEGQQEHYLSKEFILPSTEEAIYDYSVFAPNGNYYIFINFTNGYGDWLGDVYHPSEVALNNYEIKNLDLEFDLRKMETEGCVDFGGVCKSVYFDYPNFVGQFDCPQGKGCYLESGSGETDCNGSCAENCPGGEGIEGTVCDRVGWSCCEFDEIDNAPVIQSVSYQDFSDGPAKYGMFKLEGDNFTLGESDVVSVCIKEFDDCFEAQKTGKSSTHLNLLLKYDTLAETIKNGNLGKLTFTVYRRAQ